MSDVRGQRSEVRGQMSEVRGQRTEDRGQRSGRNVELPTFNIPSTTLRINSLRIARWFSQKVQAFLDLRNQIDSETSVKAYLISKPLVIHLARALLIKKD